MNCSNDVNAAQVLKLAREVIDTEIAGVQKVRDSLGAEYVALVKLCLEKLHTGGKLVLCGVGKSGHISKKLAATLASTGARAVFMHPVEAMHGDLGVVAPNDLLLAVSYSGETDELLRVLPAVKRMGVPIVAITGKPESRLSGYSDLVVPMTVEREADPFNLAPTTTTTALAALGDSLAMVLLACQNFELSDYAKNHPAGAIGRTITLTVKDCMRTGERCAAVKPGVTVREAILAMTKARDGAVAIVGEDNELLGIFTDGDFRRAMTRDDNILHAPIESVMTPNPISINQSKLAVEILKILEKRKIDDIVAVDDDGRFVGLVDIQDLPKFKVM
ncbi:MAG: KpsF/GutQ family sugar-phosphate isomerase [Victivallales bacterium]|nr:KpsF/GutQ family sugar-phosphate isomerase [Victivallales bacterium]